jgi:uncharacterized protein (TIGR02246 family)
MLRSLVLLSAALPLMGALAPADPLPLPYGTAARDSATVHELWATLDRHWNSGDARAFADLYTEDASFIFVDRADTLSGHAEILERFTGQFASTAPDLRHRSTPGAIRRVAPDIIVMDGTVEILRVTDPDEGNGDVVLTFAIFALMRPVAGELRIELLRVYQMA